MESIFNGIPKTALSQQRYDLPSTFNNTIEIDSIDLTTSAANPSLKMKSHTMTGAVLEIVNSAGATKSRMFADGSIVTTSSITSCGTFSSLFVTTALNVSGSATVSGTLNADDATFDTIDVTSCGTVSTLYVTTALNVSGSATVSGTLNADDATFDTLDVTSCGTVTTLYVTTALNVSGSATVSGTLNADDATFDTLDVTSCGTVSTLYVTTALNVSGSATVSGTLNADDATFATLDVTSCGTVSTLYVTTALNVSGSATVSGTLNADDATFATLDVTSCGTVSTLYVTTALNVSGSATISGTVNAVNGNFNTLEGHTVCGTILPGNTGTNYIGSAAKPWRGLYATSLYVNDYDSGNDNTHIQFVDLPTSTAYDGDVLTCNNASGGRLYRTPTVSSRRYKTNIELVADSDWILKLDTVTFNMCGMDRNLVPDHIFRAVKEPGFIAEDTETIAGIPECIIRYRNDMIFGINYNHIWPYTVHKIQEHHKKIDSLADFVAGSDILLKNLCTDYEIISSRIDSISRKIESEDTVVSREYNITLDSDGMPLHASVFTIDHDIVGEYSITFDAEFGRPPFILVTLKAKGPTISYVSTATTKKVIVHVCDLAGTSCDPELLYVKISEK